MRFIIILITIGLFMSCEHKPKPIPETVEVNKILIAKSATVINATAFDNGYTKYLLAFNDGWTERTSFGFYSCLKVGDTILFTKDKGDDDYWLRMQPKCE